MKKLEIKDELRSMFNLVKTGDVTYKLLLCDENYDSYPDDIDCLDDGGGMDMGYMDDPDYEE